MMADVVKIATRDSYGNAVTALAAEHDDILVLDADLAGATKTAIFKKAYPDRHINCGIAEADLIGVSGPFHDGLCAVLLVVRDVCGGPCL